MEVRQESVLNLVKINSLTETRTMFISVLQCLYFIVVGVWKGSSRSISPTLKVDWTSSLWTVSWSFSCPVLSDPSFSFWLVRWHQIPRGVHPQRLRRDHQEQPTLHLHRGTHLSAVHQRQHVPFNTCVCQLSTCNREINLFLLVEIVYQDIRHNPSLFY